MAERLKIKLLDSDRLVDLVAGPDAYRDIPRLLDTIEVTNQSVCMYVCMYVCLMSWGPTEGQQTKFCSCEIIQSKYCSLGKNSS